MSPDVCADRVLESLYGLCVGATIGAPAFGLSPGEVRRRFGSINDFLEAPEVNDEILLGLLTLQSYLREGESHPSRMADLLRERQHLLEGTDPDVMAAISLTEEDRYREPEFGSTAGAAVRCQVLGYTSGDINEIINTTIPAARATHGTNIGIASATAASCAVGASVVGLYNRDVVAWAIYGASRADRMGIDTGELFAPRIRAVSRRAKRMRPGDLAATFGAGRLAYETVPLAIALAYRAEDAEQAILSAANAGGNTTGVGAITGAIAGAQHGVPDHWKARIDVWALGLQDMVDAVMEKRSPRGTDAEEITRAVFG